MQKKIRIGSGAGYSGDRIEPAVELAEKGNLDYLVFECLAERTIAIALQNKRMDPGKGYDPLLEERMAACLPVCHEKGIGSRQPGLGRGKDCCNRPEAGIKRHEAGSCDRR